MSKYKPSASSGSASAASSQPIWTTLTTPSQIARKYASIAPIWCHISRPRQLKKKFASTFHQAQSLLSRTHSKENSVNSKSNELDDDELTTTNTYKNSLQSTEPSAYDYSFKKRDSSLDYKASRPSAASSSSYVSSYTTNPVSNARWTCKPVATAATALKESYDNSSLLEDSQAASGDSSAPQRRPIKYVSSKYGPSGAKTERITTKSSKSSPNLVAKDKDYESFYTDRYEPKWTNSSYNNYVNHGHSQYHSNPSAYNYNSYSNYANNDPATSYNHYNSNREDKWNELDSMLGAQSALLSRLESDFVANRNKLKTSSGLNPTMGSSAAVNSTGGTYKTPAYAAKYGAANLASKSHSNMSSIGTENDHLSSYVPSRYRTPTNKASTTAKYTAKLDELEQHQSHKKANKKPASFLSTAKTEPLIGLINTLDLDKKSDDTDEKLLGIEKTLDESINKVLSESMAENFADLAASAAPLVNQAGSSVPTTPNQTNSHDFVDDFINDYINSTLLNSDANADLLLSNGPVNNAPGVCNGAGGDGGAVGAKENSAAVETNRSVNSLSLKSEATDNLGSLVSVHETPSWFVFAWQIFFSVILSGLCMDLIFEQTATF
ncbi:hypothetical protein BpHYR1_021736 [Brachionus plicatilis]|uniref:Uncharacterized protein n=1 Tax=Brachionus plicatilis TaxID=10195 RepID=A0A3M7RWU0_BRAPC|nr:hypothetical protein BpHYR1_021736 [Brachionus plicatilis]